MQTQIDETATVQQNQKKWNNNKLVRICCICRWRFKAIRQLHFIRLYTYLLIDGCKQWNAYFLKHSLFVISNATFKTTVKIIQNLKATVNGIEWNAKIAHWKKKTVELNLFKGNRFRVHLNIVFLFSLSLSSASDDSFYLIPVEIFMMCSTASFTCQKNNTTVTREN